MAADGAVMRVPVESTASAWNAGVPNKLFSGAYYAPAANPQRTYDVTPDGQRFLMIRVNGAEQGLVPPAIVVNQHFDKELKRLFSTK